MINTAICGCRGHYEKFIGQINSYADCRVTAIWDPDADTAIAAARKAGCRFVENYEDILADESIDGVLILTENMRHRDMVVMAAAAGKHIFLEKPLCLTKRTAAVMKKAVKTGKVHFFLSDPFVRAPIMYLKKLIEDGRLGTMTAVHIRVSGDSGIPETDPPIPPDYRKITMGGGVVADTGNHALHIMHYLLGKPLTVNAKFSSFHEAAVSEGSEEQAMMIFEYPQNILASVECSLISSDLSTEIMVCGMGGTAVVKNLGGRPGKWEVSVQSGREGWRLIDPADLPADPYAHTEYWITMIKDDISSEKMAADDRGNSGMTIDAAADCAEMIEAIYKSASTGKTVKI